MTEAPCLTFAKWLAEPVPSLGLRHRACDEGRIWVGQRPASRALWLAFDRADWMLWLAANAGVDRRRVVLAAAACAWHALRHVPAGDERPARAIDLARRYGLGEDITNDDLRSAAAAAYAAAYYAAAAYAAAAAAYAAAAARHREHLAMCRSVRRVIGWPRVARALRAQGVEVVR